MIMLRKFVEEFVSFVPLQLPQLLDATKMEEPQYFDDYALLEFPLPHALDLEEVMDMLEDDIQMILLYHHIPSRSTTFGHACCAYSNPAFGQMFKVNAKTDGSGLVKSVVVTVYESLEYMCSDLCLDLKLHSGFGYLKYQRKKEEVMVDFL